MCSPHPPEKINRILQCWRRKSGGKKMKGLAATRRIISFLRLVNVNYTCTPRHKNRLCGVFECVCARLFSEHSLVPRYWRSFARGWGGTEPHWGEGDVCLRVMGGDRSCCFLIFNAHPTPPNSPLERVGSFLPPSPSFPAPSPTPSTFPPIFPLRACLINQHGYHDDCSAKTENRAAYFRAMTHLTVCQQIQWDNSERFTLRR